MKRPELKLCCNCEEWRENGCWKYLYCHYSNGWNDTCKDWRFSLGQNKNHYGRLLKVSRQFLFSITKNDLIVETLARGGPGGQNQNKISSFVRIRHPESGAMGESKEERTQWQNKKIALKRLTEHPKFKVWLNQKYYELKTGKTIDQIVDEMMDLKNIKMEIRDEKGRWVIYEEKEDATTLLS